MEHKAAVKRCDVKNGIAVHAWEQQHRVNWDEASVWYRNLGIGGEEYSRL